MLYVHNALVLLEEAATKALTLAKLNFSDIDGLIIVSSSGIATPSLDALLMEKLGLKRYGRWLMLYCYSGELMLRIWRCRKEDTMTQPKS